MKPTFDRWEAGQVYAEQLLLNGVATIQDGGSIAVPESFIAAFRTVLNDAKLDDALKAQASRSQANESWRTNCPLWTPTRSTLLAMPCAAN